MPDINARTAARTLRMVLSLGLVAGVLSVVSGLLLSPVANAATSTPPVQLAGGPAPSVLYGESVPVSLTASLPAGSVKGYNLAFRAVLPAGTSYVAGSAGGDGEPRVIANAPTSGRTTLVWGNVDDLVASSGHTLAFQVAYNPTSGTATPRYDVGDPIGIDTGAYLSTQPRDEADFTALGVPTPGTGSYTGWAEQSTTTQLTAIKIRKSEPHPEGEIPRGVHDHQTVYTLTVTNNGINPTNTVVVDDYLPAGLEFLGCAGTADHSSAVEYAGSGPIVVAHPTTAEKCVQPDLVETVDTDPDGSGPLTAGVYTHVRWSAVGDFTPGQVKQLTYAAAIPIRENTVWERSGPPTSLKGHGVTVDTLPDTTGQQTANLDNNTGPETYDEQPLLNGALAGGTYQAPGKAGVAVSDEGTLLRTAEDIAIQKSNDNGGLEQGDLTRWTIDLQVSEYRYVDHVVIHDVVPNGLCPLGTTNLTTRNSATDSECAPTAGKLPSAPYTSVAEQPNGTFDVTWDESTYPTLARLVPSATRQLTFWTRTRSSYQSAFEDSTPVLSRDAVTNNVDTHGDDWIRCAPADPTCTGDGTKIDADETDGEPDTDVSGSGKAASGPVILKQVAATLPASADCSDLAAAHYGKTVPEHGPGDVICWKLRLDFPQHLDTTSQDVFDVLPSGIDYVPGSWHVTGNNTVQVGSIDTTTAGRLRWPIGGGGSHVDVGGQVFEVTLQTTVGSPLGHASGDIQGNLQKFSYSNTPGSAFTLRDRVDFALKLPVLGLLKGVRRVNAGTVNGPNVDNVAVKGSDLVQYRVDVTNSGTADATGARVWDLLPAGISCADVQADTISDGGTCVTASATSSRLQWSGLDVAEGASRTLTYTVKVPAGVSPAQSFTNTAGVVELTYVGNTGTRYRLVPANTVVKDPAMPAANVPAAQDTSVITVPAAAVAKTAVTALTESGNTVSQATVGERVDYTVTTTIPNGTTIYGTPTVTDVLGANQKLVAGSLCAAGCSLDGVALPTSGVTVAESPANTVKATFPTSYANTSGHGVALVLRFAVTVLDTAANIRGANLTNTATLAYVNLAGAAKTVTGSVATRIVEPKLTLAKTHLPPGVVSPSQLVTFTVRAAAAAGTYYSPVHEAVVVDTLPAGTEPVDASGNLLADGATVPVSGGVWNATARTITWNRTTTPSLALVNPGASTDLGYRVRLESEPVGGRVYTNTVAGKDTSLDASVGGVRGPGSPGTTVGDYSAAASDAVSVLLPSIAKDASPDPRTVGQSVTWHVRVTVPRSVRYLDTTVVDTVPDGFDVDGYGAITCVSGCIGSDPVIATLPVAAGASGATTAAWYVGDLAPATTDRVYDLVLTGHVRSSYRAGGADVVAGTTLTNSAVVRTDRTDKVTTVPTTVPATFDDTAGPATASTRLVEPKLTITKAASGGPQVKPGDTVTYAVTVKNTGTSPAYDVVVTDQPDAELVGVTLGAGASYSTDGWTALDPDLVWAVPGPLAVGASVVLGYTATVAGPTLVVPGQQIRNTADVDRYHGVPKTERDAAPGVVWRQYAGPDSTVTLTVAPFTDLGIVKTVDAPEHQGGDTVTWTLTVTNAGPSPAENVTVDDALPTAVTGGSVSPSPACALASGAVHCNLGTLASGASKVVTVTTTAKGLPGTAHGVDPHAHQLTISKEESAVALQAGETRTLDLTCSNGGAMADGSVEVMHVDQGTGSPADVVVQRASTQSVSSYRFTIANTTTGQAQVKLFGTCLPPTTEVTSGHAHPLNVGAPTTQDTGVMTPGRHVFTLPVDAAHHAVAPGIELVQGNARLVASEPVAGGWQLTVEVLDTARATLSLRGLSNYTGAAGTPAHTHALGFAHVVRQVSLPPGESVQRVTCADGSKGIVGTYDLPAGVVSLGHEPQPINRDFRLLNTNASAVTATLDLECLSIETGVARDELVTVTNTATTATTTYDWNPANNTSSASTEVATAPGSSTPPPPPSLSSLSAVKPASNGASAVVTLRCGGSGTCTRTVSLMARVPGDGISGRVVIGRVHVRISHGSSKKIRVPIRKKYRKLVRTGRVTGYLAT